MYDRSAAYYDLFYDAVKDYEAESRDLITTIETFAPGARSLLDVGCGTGRHIHHLSERFEVAGVDLSPAMVAVARERNPGIPITLGDVRNLDLGRRFDVVTFLFSGIAHLHMPGELQSAITSIATHLEPGGIAIIDGWIRPDALDPTQMLGGHTVATDDAVISRVDRHQVVGDLSILSLHYLVATADGVENFEEHLKLGLWPREVYEAAFVEAGLEVVSIREAIPSRDTFIARKPGLESSASRPDHAREDVIAVQGTELT